MVLYLLLLYILNILKNTIFNETSLLISILIIFSVFFFSYLDFIHFSNLGDKVTRAIGTAGGLLGI